MPHLRSSIPAIFGERFTVSQAQYGGLSEGRLRQPDLARPTRGVRTLLAPQSVRERTGAIGLVLPEGAVFSHCTAAMLHGIPVPASHEADRLHVSTAGTALVRRRETITHQGAECRQCTEVNGIPVTDPVETWLDLGALYRIDDLVIAGDYLAAEHLALMRSRVAQGARRRGIVKIRQALDLVRIGSGSPMESFCRVEFVRSGLLQPELNAEVTDRFGTWIATVDFLWREQRVIAEYDGAHHDDPGQRKYDAARRRQLLDNDWRVIEITSRDLPHLHDVCASIRAALRQPR